MTSESVPASVPQMDDVALTTAAAAGDREARAALAARLLHRVRTTARYVVDCDGDADDVAQLAVGRILEASGSYGGKGSLESWADRISVRIAFRLTNRRKRQRELLRAHAYELAYQPLSADQSLTRFEVRRHVARCLARLPERRRIVVLLKLVYHYSVAEIAALLDLPANTVRDRLRTGRWELRRAMTRDPALRDLLGRKP